MSIFSSRRTSFNVSWIMWTLAVAIAGVVGMFILAKPSTFARDYNAQPQMTYVASTPKGPLIQGSLSGALSMPLTQTSLTAQCTDHTITLAAGSAPLGYQITLSSSATLTSTTSAYTHLSLSPEDDSLTLTLFTSPKTPNQGTTFTAQQARLDYSAVTGDGYLSAMLYNEASQLLQLNVHFTCALPLHAGL